MKNKKITYFLIMMLLIAAGSVSNKSASTLTDSNQLKVMKIDESGSVFSQQILEKLFFQNLASSSDMNQFIETEKSSILYHANQILSEQSFAYRKDLRRASVRVISRFKN